MFEKRISLDDLLDIAAEVKTLVSPAAKTASDGRTVRVVTCDKTSKPLAASDGSNARRKLVNFGFFPVDVSGPPIPFTGTFSSGNGYWRWVGADDRTLPLLGPRWENTKPSKPVADITRAVPPEVASKAEHNICENQKDDIVVNLPGTHSTTVFPAPEVVVTLPSPTIPPPAAAIMPIESASTTAAIQEERHLTWAQLVRKTLL